MNKLRITTIAIAVASLVFLRCTSDGDGSGVNGPNGNGTAPETPTLSSPADGATGIPAGITLRWNASSGGASYHLQVSSSSSFNDFIVNEQGLTNTSLEVSDLNDSTVYFWRVKASNSYGTSNWSTVWSFITGEVIVPSPPTLSSPPDEATDLPPQLTLEWLASPGANNYTLQVSGSHTFIDLTIGKPGITATDYNISGLEFSTTYYWRVKAVNDQGNSDWSDVWSFTTLTATGKWTTYNTANSGLADDIVNEIEIDLQGNLWFATSSGVSRFDGSTWISYNTSNTDLEDSYIRSLGIDSSGIIWVGTNQGGAGSFDGSEWVIYTESNSGLTSNSIYEIAVDGANRKWFSTGVGLCRFDGANWIIYTAANSGLPDDGVVAITVDPFRGLWFTTRSGATYFNGTDWITYDQSNSGMAPGLPVTVAIDASGTKWFGMDHGKFSGGGVSKFDGSNWTTYDTSNSGLADDHVFAIAVDRAGYMWFGTAGGVSKFDGSNWITFTTANSGLAGDYVTSIVIDESDNKWFGTFGGVSMLRE